MKPKFLIRCFNSKKRPGDTYLALICKILEKTTLVSYDKALIYQLCDCSVLQLLQPGEEIEIDA